MKKYLSDYLFLFLIAGSIILLDQLTKAWIRDTLSLGGMYRPDLWISGYIRLIYWKNTGAAFGMFQDGNTIFMILSSFVSLVIIYYFPQVPREDRIVRLAMAMLLGGAVGNLLDRINYGYVTDFVSVLEFPVFNVADASISLGVVVLFIGMWLQERDRKRAEASAAAAPQGAPDAVDVYPSSETPAAPAPSALAEDTKSE